MNLQKFKIGRFLAATFTISFFLPVACFPQASFVLRGIIFDKEDGKPLPGATVKAYPGNLMASS